MLVSQNEPKPDPCMCQCFGDGKNDFVQMSLADYQKITAVVVGLRERCSQLENEIATLLQLNAARTHNPIFVGSKN